MKPRMMAGTMLGFLAAVAPVKAAVRQDMTPIPDRKIEKADMDNPLHACLGYALTNDDGENYLRLVSAVRRSDLGQVEFCLIKANAPEWFVRGTMLTLEKARSDIDGACDLNRTSAEDRFRQVVAQYSERICGVQEK